MRTTTNTSQPTPTRCIETVTRYYGYTDMVVMRRNTAGLTNVRCDEKMRDGIMKNPEAIKNDRGSKRTR